jgi:serine/threonine protein kinase
MNLNRGDLFDNGKYKLHHILGQGVSADAWLAEETRLGRKVVIKILRTNFWNPVAKLRFETEAVALAQVGELDNIITLFSFVPESSDGLMYLSLEYGGDKTLYDCIHGDSADFNNLSLRGKVNKLNEVVCALGKCHAKKIIHRDLKPNNFLWDGQVLRLCDFGMANMDDKLSMTMDDQFVGNMLCPAPEQFVRDGVIDSATDVFNLGGLIYHALTGDSVYGTTNLEVLKKKATSRGGTSLRSMEQLPVQLRAVLEKSMEYNKGRRYPSAEEMCDDLQRFLDGESVLAKRPKVYEKIFRWTMLNKWPTASLLTLLLLLTNVYSSSVSANRASSQTQEVLASFHGVMRGLDPNQPVTYGESQTSSLSDLFDTLVASDSINSEVKAEIFYDIGTRHMFFDAFYEAERNFSQSLEHAPNNDLAIINLAWCERELGHQKRNDSEHPLQDAKVIYDRALARLEPIINRAYPTGDVKQDYIILFAKNRYATLLLAELKSQSTTRALAILEKIDIELNSRSDIEPWLLPVNTGNRASVQARLENYQESLELHQLSERQFLAAGMANHPELSFAYVGQVGMFHMLGRVKESNAMSEKTLKHRRDIGGGYTNFYLRYLFDCHRRLLEYGSESSESVIARVLAEFDSRYHDNRREGKIDPELLSFHDQYCQLD